MKLVYAYCFQNGVIGFGEKVEEGAIQIAQSYSERRLKGFIEAKARHSHDRKTLLVPSVPEAANELAAANALGDWLVWVAKSAYWAVDVAVMTRKFTDEEVAVGAITDETFKAVQHG